MSDLPEQTKVYKSRLTGMQRYTKVLVSMLEPGLASVEDPDSANGVNNFNLYLDLDKLTESQLEMARKDAMEYFAGFKKLLKKTMKSIAIDFIVNNDEGAICPTCSYNSVVGELIRKFNQKHHNSYIRTLKEDHTISDTQRYIIACFVKRFLYRSAVVVVPSFIRSCYMDCECDTD